MDNISNKNHEGYDESRASCVLQIVKDTLKALRLGGCKLLPAKGLVEEACLNEVDGGILLPLTDWLYLTRRLGSGGGQ